MSRQNGECFIYQLELFLCFSCQDVSFNLVGWFSRTPPLAVVFGLTNQKREQTRFNGKSVAVAEAAEFGHTFTFGISI